MGVSGTIFDLIEERLKWCPILREEQIIERAESIPYNVLHNMHIYESKYKIYTVFQYLNQTKMIWITLSSFKFLCSNKL